MRTIGTTEYTYALDAVIRHQEGIIESLTAQLKEDKNERYYERSGWLWGRKRTSALTATGHDLSMTIRAFELGLAALRQQLVGAVRAETVHLNS